MCSYCGCEAEPLITALMDDHAVIADHSYRIVQALETGDTAAARVPLGELAECFRVHSLKEDAGLFTEMVAGGEAVAEIERLLDDHRRLRPLLASAALLEDPVRLRAALADLEAHAQTEENDLFPYALQVLPAERWDRINHADAGVADAPAPAR